MKPVLKRYSYSNGFDQLFNRVIFLSHFNGSDGSTVITNVKSLAATAFNGASISTLQSRFSGSSLLFDGVNDYVEIANTNNVLTFGTNSCTVEGWFYFNSLPTIFNLFKKVSDFSSTGLEVSSNKLRFWIDGTGAIFTGNTTLQANIWYHLAVVRRNNAFQGYVNGVLDGSGTSSASIDFGGGWVGRGGFNSYLNGYVDELRITSAARDIVLPVSPFPDY